VTAGVSGYSEFADQVDAGKMRLLALSSDKPVEGIDGPTLTEQGYDIVLPNWRGVVAPPDITAEDQEAIIAMIEDMRDSPQWERALEQNGWSDFFKTGDEFAAFIEEEDERSAQILEDLGLVK
jgi:putative tricarboxylic transport membrane protein